MEGSKRPETERKYDSQYARYLVSLKGVGACAAA